MGKQIQEIPTDLASQLKGMTLRALAHPRRRQILRALTAKHQKLSTIELVPLTGAPDAFSCTSYHARRLEESDLIAQVGSEMVEGGLTYHFSSLVSHNHLVLAVLRATEVSDRQHLALTTT